MRFHLPQEQLKKKWRWRKLFIGQFLPLILFVSMTPKQGRNKGWGRESHVPSKILKTALYLLEVYEHFYILCLEIFFLFFYIVAQGVFFGSTTTPKCTKSNAIISTVKSNMIYIYFKIFTMQTSCSWLICHRQSLRCGSDYSKFTGPNRGDICTWEHPQKISSNAGILCLP